MFLLSQTIPVYAGINPSYMLVIKKVSPSTGEIDFLFKSYSSQDRLNKAILCHELRNYIFSLSFGITIEEIMFNGNYNDFISWFNNQLTN